MTQWKIGDLCRVSRHTVPYRHKLVYRISRIFDDGGCIVVHQTKTASGEFEDTAIGGCMYYVNLVDLLPWPVPAGRMMRVMVDEREHATILAALRYFQQADEVPQDFLTIQTNDGTVDPCTAEEIDQLCERINDAHETADETIRACE